jgi:DNA repair exonuclease SbcCD ATPase subunit
MKIIQLTVENIKRVQAVTIEPKGPAVIIGGDNRQGKSSTLDSIAYALGGGRLIPEKPIRNGAKHARIEVDLGELVVERTFTKKGSTLKVTPKDGPSVSSPQAVLDKLIGKLSFDPLAFLEMEPKKQVQTLKELVGLDFNDLDRKKEDLYEQRKEINLTIKNLNGQIEGIPEHLDLPAPVDVNELLSKIEEAEKHNGQLAWLEQAKAEAARQAEKAAEEIARCETEITELRERALKLKERQGELEQSKASQVETVESLANQIATFETIDAAPLKQAIANAEATNRKIHETEQRKTLTKELRSKNNEATKLTLAFEGIDEKKEQRLAEVKFPVPGLSFSEDGVLLNNLPLEQASQREQIALGVGIGFAMNPGLKIALVRNASLLDDNGLAMVAQIAEEQGGQIWLERVSKGAECSVVIEDGLVSEDRTQDGTFDPQRTPLSGASPALALEEQNKKEVAA